MCSATCRLLPDLASPANQTCGSLPSGCFFVYVLPLLSVTLEIVMTLLSFVTRAIRLPIDGTCRFQVDEGGMLLVRCSVRTIRMPGAGAVPAAAAFSATDRPL